MTERLPRPAAGRIRDASPLPGEITGLPIGTVLVRVHALGGQHPLGWDELRAFGPTTSRDHHPPPRRVHPSRRIAYATIGGEAFTAALAEFFQDGAGGVGPMDLVTRTPTMTAFELDAGLTLLDLDSGWVTRAGGNQAIRTGPRGVARDWARAIYRHHGDLDGLAYSSSVWGPGRCVALWERAEHALPSAPVLTRALDDPHLHVAVAIAAEQLGTFPITS